MQTLPKVLTLDFNEVMDYAKTHRATITRLFYPFRFGRDMAQQPKLRKKKVGKSAYWFTKAGETYFDKFDAVPLFGSQKAVQ